MIMHHAERRPTGKLSCAMHEVGAMLAARLTLDELEDTASRVALADPPGLGGQRYSALSSSFDGVIARNGARWVG
jgi:hypothetical protein